MLKKTEKCRRVVQNIKIILLLSSYFRDVAQPGSALAWGARGRWFESSRPD